MINRNNANSGSKRKKSLGNQILKNESRNSPSSLFSIAIDESTEPSTRKKTILMKMNIRSGGIYRTLLPVRNSLVKKPGLNSKGRTLRMIRESNVK